MLIYKIFRSPEWATLDTEGRTMGAPIDVEDGFIHFSTAQQAGETAAKHFAGADGLILAALDSDALGDKLIWEPSRGGALFPHLYRELFRHEVIWAKPLPLVQGSHLFPEEFGGHIDPTREQFDTFKTLNRDHPVQMLNLVRLRDQASYPEGHELAGAGLSGAEAYSRYGAQTGPVFTELGGKIVWRGAFQSVLIGPPEDNWDLAFVAQYPSAHAFLAMVSDPVYKAAVVHRQAAVTTSRLIRCAPAEAGSGFA